MIKVKLTKKSGIIKNITVKGHALYDDFGKDIVCAAVSSTIITSVNASLLIDENSLSYLESNGLNINILIDDEVTTKIINNMITNLLELEKAYHNNIKIKEKNNEKINVI